VAAEMLKTCFKCNTAKPLTEFYRHSRMGDGHLGKCKTCTKNDAKEARAKRIGYYREYDRERSSQPHRKELHKRVDAAYKAEHPKRRKAQQALGNAVRDGRVIPQPCFICGDRAEGHHPNYDAPLDVVWLCPTHHKQAHALVQAA
jgi:hypothetical protein